MSKTILDRNRILTAIQEELEHAYNKHREKRWGRYEFYAILKEEVDEVWDAIKNNESFNKLVLEIIQVATMCIRYLETGDRYKGIIIYDMLNRKREVNKKD